MCVIAELRKKNTKYLDQAIQIGAFKYFIFVIFKNL